MANYFRDNHDLEYYFDKGIDWEALYPVTEFRVADTSGAVGGAAPKFRAHPDAPADAAEARDLYRDIAEMVGELVAEEVAPRAAAIDRQGHRLVDGEVVSPPEMDELFAMIKELDLHGLNLPRELGGMAAPMILYFINTELFARGDVSIMAHNSFHGGIAMAMLMFSIREGTTHVDAETRTITDTRFADGIAEILAGDAWGCMDITEPDAGSDMAALRAFGEQDADGNWFVTGQKIFITSGHGKYHFVIARTETADNPDDPFAGLAGLSFFLVPAYRDNPDGTRTRLATVDRLEEKMGHHGSVTAAISFDRTPAYLIGARGEGFGHMLTLMNNARLGVGFESLGLCEAAYRLAAAYAAERPSMGKTIDRHEMIADYLDEMRTDIQGIRAIAVYGAFHEEMAQKLELLSEWAGSDEVQTDIAPTDGAARSEQSPAKSDNQDLGKRIAHHKACARRVTPLLKYLAAEKAVEMARRCLQIHGGNGYMKEYGAEKLLRDAMVMPIYEGTSQIQSLMAMKDALSAILKSPQEFVVRTAQARWRSLSARDPLERRVARLVAQSQSVLQSLVTRTVTDKVRSLRKVPFASWSEALLKNWDPKRDFAFAMLHAERLTRMLADVAIAEVLLEQARRHDERRDVLERYLERAEPRCRALADEIGSTGARLLAELAGKLVTREREAG
jgi:hypothetical protein